MARIKLIGYKTRVGKDGNQYVDIHYITDNQLRGSQSSLAGGFEVGRDNFKYDPSVPLNVNAEYELLGSVREFRGEKYWRASGITLIKK